ncbi:hypothetical protein RhiJN_26591 [Ceratobasidium sp. AG-Ba]|nr:hypothetical protein RhiJN_26591 [Ceratobasidium sp. AG-Ba]
MIQPPSLHIEVDDTSASDLTQPSSSQQQRPNSLTPSRRDRPRLRSSPLAGPSYASDGAGGIVEQSSALEEEIARRKSLLVAGLDDEELARLAALSHSPTGSLSIPGNDPVPPVPSRQNSSDSSTGDGHAIPSRKARPSFISLAPPASPTGSSLQIPAPPATLRNRHSSPNIARAASLDAPSQPLPTAPVTDKTANWMTAAPAPSFSRSSMHTRGIVLPVKADSKSGQRIRRKSMPSAPASHLRHHQALAPPVPVPSLSGQIRMAETETEVDVDIEGRGQGQSIRPKKSSRSLRSFFRHEHEEKDKDKDVPPVPLLPPPGLRSRASSTSSSSVQMPPTPNDSAVHLPPVSPQTQVPHDNDHHEEGRVKRLWARVMHGVRRIK